MKYDPIKRSLGDVFGKQPLLRIIFYKILDILLLRTWHIKKEIRKIKTHLPHAPKLLDAGSGFGQYTYYLIKKFKNSNVKGIDVKPEQVEDCNTFFEKIKLSYRVQFEEADLVTFKEAETFDFILCVDVMEHIEEDRQVLKNFFSSLKTGGVLLISTPSDQGGSDAHHEEDASFIEEHVRNGYNKDEIIEKLKDSGFSEVDCRYSYGIPGSFSWKLFMKYPILLLNFSKMFFILLPFYYVLTFPLMLILNYADLYLKHKKGTGLIVKAKKL